MHCSAFFSAKLCKLESWFSEIQCNLSVLDLKYFPSWWVPDSCEPGKVSEWDPGVLQPKSSEFWLLVLGSKPHSIVLAGFSVCIPVCRTKQNMMKWDAQMFAFRYAKIDDMFEQQGSHAPVPAGACWFPIRYSSSSSVLAAFAFCTIVSRPSYLHLMEALPPLLSWNLLGDQ